MDPLQPNAHHSCTPQCPSQLDIHQLDTHCPPQLDIHCPSQLENNHLSQLDTHCPPQLDPPVPITAGYPLRITAGHSPAGHSLPTTAGYSLSITAGHPSARHIRTPTAECPGAHQKPFPKSQGTFGECWPCAQQVLRMPGPRAEPSPGSREICTLKSIGRGSLSHGAAAAQGCPLGPG